jgi:hypothetical protein
VNGFGAHWKGGGKYMIYLIQGTHKKTKRKWDNNYTECIMFNDLKKAGEKCYDWKRQNRFTEKEMCVYKINEKDMQNLGFPKLELSF